MYHEFFFSVDYIPPETIQVKHKMRTLKGIAGMAFMVRRLTPTEYVVTECEGEFG